MIRYDVGEDSVARLVLDRGVPETGGAYVLKHGVVLDPVGLVGELDGLARLGIPVTPANFQISETAHIVFPWHRQLDGAREIRKGKDKIGTTKRGIGPAYGDKAARVGMRMIDLINRERFPQKLRERLAENNEVIQALGGTALDYDQLLAEYTAAGDRLR